MYYFIGIKGSGMASLATILYDLGHKVAGSDIDKYIFIEDELKKEIFLFILLTKIILKMGMMSLLEMPLMNQMKKSKKH